MKTILISPLGWGLGHASRDIAIVDQLHRLGYRIILASNNPSSVLILEHFNDIETVELKSYGVRYSRGNCQFWPMLLVAIKLPFANRMEHRKLKSLIPKFKVDVVISDNRYGLWSRLCKSIIITHQLQPIPPYPFKWATYITKCITRRWLRNFDEVWIPDFEQNPLAGRLSAKNGMQNLRYVGSLSRFATTSLVEVQFPTFQMVVVASGPEPHRQIFVEIAAKLAKGHNLKCLIIEGSPELGVAPRLIDGIWHVGHLHDAEFAHAVVNSEYLLLRGGYSTIMDMLTLGVSGLLVPTPGQTEQEYLARHLNRIGLFNTVTQADLPNIGPNLLVIKRIDSIKSATPTPIIVSAIG